MVNKFNYIFACMNVCLNVLFAELIRIQLHFVYLFQNVVYSLVLPQ